MPLTIDHLLDDALAESDPLERVAAVENLVPYLSDAQRRRVWAATVTAVGTIRASVVLRELAPFAGQRDLADALTALRRLPGSSRRFYGLAAVLPHLAAADRQAVEDELIRTLATDDDPHDLLYFARHGFTPDGLARVVAAMLETGRAGAATALREVLPPALRRAVVVAAAALEEEQARASALGAMAPALSEAEAVQVAPAARAITDPMQRALVLTALGRASAPLAEDALAAVLEFDGDVQLLLRFLPDLAGRLSPPRLDELIDRLATARSGLNRLWAMAAVAPCLDADQVARALSAVGALEAPEIWLYGADRFLPHLPPDLRGPLQDLCVRLMSDHGVQGGTSRLLAHLRAEQIDEVLRLVTGPGGDMSKLHLLVPHLSEEQVAFALKAVLAQPEAETRFHAAGPLAPRLDAATAATVVLVLFDAGAGCPDDVAPDTFIAACVAFAGRVDGESRRSLLEAGAVAAERVSEYSGAWQLVDLAAEAADETQRDSLLTRAVAMAGNGGRSGRSVIRNRIVALLAAGEH